MFAERKTGKQYTLAIFPLEKGNTDNLNTSKHRRTSSRQSIRNLESKVWKKINDENILFLHYFQ